MIIKSHSLNKIAHTHGAINNTFPKAWLDNVSTSMKCANTWKQKKNKFN